MTVFEIILLVGMIAGIVAAILEALGKKKAAEILRIVAKGVDRSKAMLPAEMGEVHGERARKMVTNMIKLEAETSGKLEDLDKFLKKNGLNT